MQREILFRGNRIDNGEWIEGDLCQDHITGKFYISRQDGYPPTWNDPGGCDIFICKEVIPETIGQYTGLTDKNGNKIFEGDIIIFSDKKIQQAVEFRRGQFMAYQLGTIGSYVGLGYCDWEKHSEIIGNIHDNG